MRGAVSQRESEHESRLQALCSGARVRIPDAVLRSAGRRDDPRAHLQAELIAQAAVRDGERVLDLGCGTGTLAIWLKQAVPGALVTGVDADEAMLARARRKALRDRVELRLDRAMAQQLPYADGSFERVVSSLFFHHLQPNEKRVTLRDVYRVLAPEGQLHVADWGKPNPLLRMMFYAVQIVDGFENTRDNVEGRLGQFFKDAGFLEVAMPTKVNTCLGAIALYRAVKPK